MPWNLNFLKKWLDSKISSKSQTKTNTMSNRIDPTTLKKIEALHPKIKTEAYQIYQDIVEALKGRVIVRFSQGLRTWAEQDQLYTIGRRGKVGEKIVTNAKGGQSLHNFGLAVDIVLLKDTNGDGTFDSASWETNVDFDGDGKADWREVVDIFKMYGWEWGGDWRFKDLPHFQKTFGNSVASLRAKYNAKQFIPNTTYVKI